MGSVNSIWGESEARIPIWNLLTPYIPYYVTSTLCNEFILPTILTCEIKTSDSQNEQVFNTIKKILPLILQKQMPTITTCKV